MHFKKDPPKKRVKQQERVHTFTVHNFYALSYVTVHSDLLRVCNLYGAIARRCAN